MHKLSLKCFGVGDGWPTNRHHSSYLYRLGETAVLIDCGEPVSRSFQATGLSYDTVDSILISHLHFDHVGGLFMLLQGFWLRKRKKELTIHLPADGIAPVRQLLKAACLFDELLPFELTFEPLRAQQTIRLGTLSVTPHPTTHLHSFRQRFGQQHPQGYEAFCFLFESEGIRLGHSADLGAVADLHPLLQQPLDLLVCELAHMNTEQLFLRLQQARLQRVAFIHLTERQSQQVETLRTQAMQHLPGVEISFPADGAEIYF